MGGKACVSGWEETGPLGNVYLIKQKYIDMPDRNAKTSTKDRKYFPGKWRTFPGIG